jgi:DNA-binding NarL/FixJ family response regulator
VTRAVRVLVVDDSPDLRRIVRRALEASGSFEVVGEAEDGQQALHMAAQTRPDLVLLDLAMPGMGGLAALPRLQRAAPGAKIVVLSVYQGQHIRSAATSRGAVGYLEKGIPARRFVGELMMLAGLVEAAEDAIDEATRELSGEPRNVAAARRFVVDLLREQGFHDTVERVSVLVSELVTNAVIHAGGDVAVTVRLGTDHVRIEVHDPDPRPLPRRPATRELDKGGRGLLLVNELASAWGVIPGPSGKTVWVEVPRFDVDVPAAIR